MGKIPIRYSSCNSCAAPPVVIIEGECPIEGSWVLGTFCDKHAGQVAAAGVLAVCAACEGFIANDTTRAWSADDPELMRLATLGLD